MDGALFTVVKSSTDAAHAGGLDWRLDVVQGGLK